MKEDLIKRYLAGECTEAEKKQLEQLISSGKFQALFNEQSQEFWEKDPPDVSPESLSRLLQKIHQDSRFSKGKVHSRSFSLVYYSQIAAVLAIVCASWLLVNTLFLKRTFTSRTYISSHTLRTDFGQKRVIHLPDGSIAQLNSDSELTFPHDFTTNRTLTLHGEAYFRVKHDQGKPFIVQTGSLTTRVTGTAFNLFYRDSQVAVALEEGGVEVRNSGSSQKVFLTPGKQAILAKQDGQIRVSEFDLKTVLGWKDGTIYFKSTPMSEVLQLLEKWYQVDIQTGDSFPLNLPFNGEFNNENLESIISGICYALDLNYKIIGKTVIVNSGK